MTHLNHFDLELRALDARIRQLALAHGVNLRDASAVESMIREHFEPGEHGGKAKRRELRCLLILKYTLEMRRAVELSVDEYLKILREID